MKKKELWILLVVILGAFIGIIALNHSGNKGSGVVVAIQHRNEIVQEFDPAVDAVYHIQGDYGTLDVEVKDGKWRVTNEECPNHICASMGWASAEDAIPITCLPNNVMIFVKEKSE